MFDHDVEAKLNVYGGMLVTNNKGAPPNGLEDAMMRRRLVEQFAGHLATDAVVKTVGQYSTEYRLQVYVLTPAQLEKYVQRRAERLHPACSDVGSMTETQKVWLHVYATVLAALIRQGCNRQWSEMRDMAEAEANIACRRIGVGL